MDILCQRCLEPWSLPLEMTYSEKRDMQDGLGCPCCKDKDVQLTDAQRRKAEMVAALQDLLGDDLDGLACEIEDYEYFFGE